MLVNSKRMLQEQLLPVLGPEAQFNRLIPVGPYEIGVMFTEALKLPADCVTSTPLPYSTSQLRTIMQQLESENSHAVLILDLPEICGMPVNLLNIAEWFGYRSQQPSFGKVHDGLLNLNTILPGTSLLPRLSQEMGVLCAEPRWRIRYLNLPSWSANKTCEQQRAEVQQRNCTIPSAIADVWSMLLARLFLIYGRNEMVPRKDHCGRTTTLFEECPLVIYNLSYNFGLDIGFGVDPGRADGGTYACCEVPPE